MDLLLINNNVNWRLFQNKPQHFFRLGAVNDHFISKFNANIYNNRVDPFEEIRRLSEELEQERRLRKQWQERCLELEKRVKQLEATLNRILNPDTPSSQIPDTEKNTNKSPNRDPVGMKPRGKPEGGN